MSLSDDFADLLEENQEENLEEASKIYISEYNKFCKSNMQTYSGVYKDSIQQCITLDKTDVIPWEHISIVIDISKIRDISKPRITEFKVPEFIEEIQCLGDSNSGFGFNEYDRNHLKSIMIPSSVYCISKEAFKLYRKLESVHFQDDSRLNIVQDEAFAYCENITDLDLYKCSKLKTLGKNVFVESNIKVLKLNSRTRNFQPETFNSCIIHTVYIDERKYKFKDFIEMLRDNDFEAFWI